MGKGKGKRRQRAELPLFDLPLNPGTAESGTAADLELSQGPEQAVASEGPATSESAAPSSDRGGRPGLDLSSLFARRDAASEPQREQAEVTGQDGPSLTDGEQPTGAQPDHEDGSSRALDEGEGAALLGDRILGGLADLAVQVLVLGMAIGAAHGMGVTVTVADWWPFAMLMLAFSFLYWTVPLAFWGQTPGMAWVGHTARAESHQPLTFGQTFLRWLGALLTLFFLGLPILAAWTGRSLSDIISKSRTLSSGSSQPSHE